MVSTRTGAGQRDAAEHLSDASNIDASNTARGRGKRAAGKRAVPSNGLLPEPRFSRQEVKSKIRDLFKLPFDLSDAQAESILRLDQGYDMICLMGTSYGKSIIYESVAALNPGRVVIVICPLKALEFDQVDQAKAKGLTACALNEDTCHDTLSRRTMFREVRDRKYQLVYISPEMAGSEHYADLLNNESFRASVKVTVIDEAHVIAEWGNNFRKAYGELCRLRSFTGERVPFAAFSATLTTESFSVLWDALGFGCRPFWGIDTGVVRENLTYIIKRREKLPVHCMNALSIIPPDLDSKSTACSIPKSIFYRERQADCIEATKTIRRCLPPQLRCTAVRPYSSIASDGAKTQIWDNFRDGTCRTLCATDAVGMGCNVRDVEYCAIFDLKGPSPDSHITVPRLSQRWGRTGRDKTIHGVCVLFVPDWAFRPLPPPDHPNPVVSRVRNGGKPRKERLESAQWTTWRESLPEDLEQLINLNHPTSSERSPRPCIHGYFGRRFRPKTGLTVYTTLDMTDEPLRGWRAAKLAVPATWVVLDLVDLPSRDTCCCFCNPELLKLVNGVSLDASVFQKFARDFLRPLATRTSHAAPPVPPTVPAAQPVPEIPATPSRAGYLRGAQRRVASKDQVLALGNALRKWRRERSDEHGGPFTTALDILPDSVLKLLLERADVLANAVGLTADTLTRPVNWEMATVDEAESACKVIADWDSKLPLVPAVERSPQKTPASQHRAEKRARCNSSPANENQTPDPPRGAPPETPTRPRLVQHNRSPSNGSPSLVRQYLSPHAPHTPVSGPPQMPHNQAATYAPVFQPHLAFPAQRSWGMPSAFPGGSTSNPTRFNQQDVSWRPQTPGFLTPPGSVPLYHLTPPSASPSFPQAYSSPFPRITVPTNPTLHRTSAPERPISRLAFHNYGPASPPLPLHSPQHLTPQLIYPQTPLPLNYPHHAYPTPQSIAHPTQVDQRQLFAPTQNVRSSATPHRPPDTS